MNISLRQLKAFLAVAESASFTKAAERLHVSQAALSATIRELEAQLGCRLFLRTTRTVQLTEGGRLFLPRAAGVQESLAAAAAQLSSVGRQEQRILRLGVTPTVASNLMPLFLRRAAQALPDLRLELSDRPPDELQRMVEEGDLDAAFGAFFRPAVGIEHKPMFITAMLLVTPAEGPLAQIDADAPDSWHALHERPMICLPEDNPVQKLVDEALAERGITPASRVRLTHLESVVAMTEHGFGLATIPSFCELTAQRYRVRVHPLRPAVRFHYACITRAGRGAIDTVEQAARVFAGVAHEVLQHRPLEPADEATPRPRRRRS